LLAIDSSWASKLSLRQAKGQPTLIKSLESLENGGTAQQTLEIYLAADFESATAIVTSGGPVSG
jgi:hypothetical protein